MSNEIVSHQNNHSDSLVSFFESQQQLGDTTMRRDYFEHLGQDDFIDLVQQTASLVRTGDLTSQHFDGQSARLVGHEVPDQREKEQLLRDTWKVAQDFLSDNTIADQDALDYAAITVAGGLLYSHPFIDGNGRTARTLSYMMARGSKSQQELDDILSETNGGGFWQAAPIPLAMGEQSDFKGNQPEKIQWPETFAGEEDDALGGVIASSVYGDTVIRSFIEKYDQQVSQHIEASTSKDPDGSSTLMAEQFIEQLVNDPEAGMTNASELLKLHRQTRADYVHRFLEAMQLKQAVEPYKIAPGDLEIQPSDIDIVRRRKQVVIDEFGKRAVAGLLTVADQQLIHHRSYSRIRQQQTDEPDTA